MIIERKSAVDDDPRLFTLLTVGTVQSEMLTLSTARLGLEHLNLANSPNTIASDLLDFSDRPFIVNQL